MKPGPFTYHRPNSIAEAVALLGSLDNAKVLAGGQSLIAMMNFRYALPDHLVDIGRLEALTGISINGSVKIGAMTRQRDLEFSPALAAAAPLFQAALTHVGHRQTRNRGTIGGSLAHADPSAELPTVCLALDAEVLIAGAGGSRSVAMPEFLGGFMTTALEPDELLTAIRFDPWPAGHGCAFQEYARRHGDFAVVGVAVLLDRDDADAVSRAAIAVCGVGDRPIRRTDAETLLIGRAPSDAVIADAARVAAELEAVEDIHGTPSYRRHLARILTERALREAWARTGRISGRAAA